MVNRVTYTYKGMNQDITRSKHPFDFYFAANNIRILATDTQSSYSVTNELGNNLEVTIPPVSIDTTLNTINYNNKSLSYFQASEIPEIERQINAGNLPRTTDSQVIIGYTLTRNSIILFTTDDNGFDCVWEVEELLEGQYELNLLYCRNLGFSINNPIQALFNYENEIIQKVYWVDGEKQLRFINIKHSVENGDVEELIDINSNTINIVGNFDLSQPLIPSVVGGGIHTSGMIQYAYNLYRLNASQTKISPLSRLVSLDRGEDQGGGELNEIVGATPIVQIDSLDSEYTHIRLYAIKYTSFNEIPSISIITDERINSTRNFTYFDDGNIIEEVSLEEFLFLGSDPIIPRHIESKDNILFSANLKEVNFDVPLDCRAFSHRSSGGGTVYDNVRPDNTGQPIGTSFDFTSTSYDQIPLTVDAVNLDYNTFRFQSDGTTIGGEGPFIIYTLTQDSLPLDESEELQFFKDNEIYRIGIQFYNRLGQTSFVKWIADFRSREGNLQGNFNTLRVDLKTEFYDWLNDNSNFESEDDKPIGYKIVRADRTISDRTIICQGALTQMMAQTVNDASNFQFWSNEQNRREESDNLVKFPIPISRGFESNISPIIETDHLRLMNEQPAGPYTSTVGNNSDDEFDAEEIFSAKSRDNKRQQAWQYTKLFQMNTPEILFNQGITFSRGLQLNIKGLVKNTRNDIWLQRIQILTKEQILNVRETNVNSFVDNTDIAFLGIFGPSDTDTEMDFTQINREYETFIPSNNQVTRNIFGQPEVTERGQGITSYNNDSRLQYSNTMQALLTDRSDDDNEKAITSMNSFGNRCITLVQGAEDLDPEDRNGLEDLYASTGISERDGLLIGEISIPEENIYLGNIYGGNSFEAKTRNTYIEIGEYQDITSGTSIINSPGDTFVFNYRVARIASTEIEVFDDQTLQLTELMLFPVETTVDLKNRSDESRFTWDSSFQPDYNEYHSYNRVYSQQPTLVQNVSEDITFRRVNNFDNRVIASKVKVPGEEIDSWTDFLVNEFQDLDGKYGPINSLVNFRDNLFTLQDEGVAALSINPRIQVQGSDGVDIELGTGSILYDYNYLTTKSGSVNKWSTISTHSGFYYYDAFNRAWNRYYNGSIQGLSDAHGFHSFIFDNTNYDDINIDNPIKRTGAVSGYNPVTNDVYLTVLQTNKDSFTLCFNEFSNSFTSFYDYKPSMYIIKGFRMLTPDPTNATLWEHFKGNYNEFYGEIFDSKITYLVNPQNKDCVFNNIEFKSQFYNNDIDIANRTLNFIKAYNEYQETSLTPLVINNNISRKFRMWRANIPRSLENGNPSLNRMRGHWMFLDLILRNDDNYKMVLHDMNIYYTAYN